MIRRARPDDAEAVVRIFRESRADAMPWLPVLHTPEQDVGFFRQALGGEAYVSELDGAVAGFIVLRDDELDALYVAPGLQRSGVGSALLEKAKEARPDGFRFWVFQENRRARRFYEARGCRLIRETDGAANEERTPDALYEWVPGEGKREKPDPGTIRVVPPVPGADAPRKETVMHRRRIVTIVLGLAAAAATLTAVAAAAAITPPANIKSAGKIVWCSDIEYPPEELYRGSKAVGSDIDIATGVSTLMGVKAQFKNVVFDSIIPALLTKKCDAIISGMNDTAERRKQVDFVDYLKVGQAITVKKGNPQHLSTLESLSGKRVSVQSATTNRGFLVATSKKLVAQGKKPITIVTFPKDTDAFAALVAGRVDAYYADAPPAAYYAKQNSTTVQVCCHPINPFPIGIAIRKHDALRAATQKAINMLYASGAIKRIVAKWGMANAVVLLK